MITRVTELPSEDEQAVRRFVEVLHTIQRAHPLDVPLPRKDLRARLSGRSALHTGVDHAMFIASADVACAVAFVNHRYVEHHGEPVGFVGYLAARDGGDSGLASVLDRAEAWLAAQGMTRVIAPYNGAFLAGYALRTAEYDDGPVFPLEWHPPAYRRVLESAGYRATFPWWAYHVDFSDPVYRSATDRALRDPQCTIRTFDRKRFHEELDLFVTLYDETFSHSWEYHPQLAEEWYEMFDPFKAVTDPRRILFAEVGGEPVAMCLGLPDWSPHLRRMDGSSGPLAQSRFVLTHRRVARAGLAIIGVRGDQRGHHIGQTLAAALFRRFEELGLPGAEYYLVNDDNEGSKALVESFGGTGRVLYHNFDKPLDAAPTT